MPWQEVNPGAENEDPLTRAVIGAAIEVHKALGSTWVRNGTPRSLIQPCLLSVSSVPLW